MSRFDEMIKTMKTADYREKQQFLEYFLRVVENAGNRLSREEKDALLEYAYEEVDTMRKAIPEASAYKEKDLIFVCEDLLLGIVIHLNGSPEKIPEDKAMKIRALTELVNRERYLETTLDSVFAQSAVMETDVNRLLYWARQTGDEYQKGKLFLGLVHYRQDLSKLEDGAKVALTEYIASELRRLMTLDSEDTWNTLELVADVSKYFASEAVTGALKDLLGLGRNHVNYYVVETLIGLGFGVPQAVIDALAEDLEFANLTYGMLQRTGKTALFPAKYAREEYLAKSDLVHWLTYPTELGKAPDEIVYIGKIKQLFRKEVFHVYKYRSDSETLDDALRNKWLIGWSSNEGGTFSNFDEFAPFEGMPTEKVLKRIRKELIG